jgi:hypothetical protein
MHISHAPYTSQLNCISFWQPILELLEETAALSLG